MEIGEINLMNLEVLTGTQPWYKKYCDLPFKHLGTDPMTGIDCFNLCKLVYKEILSIDIPYSTNDFCQDTDEHNWYNKIIDFPMEKASTDKYGWFVKEKENSWIETVDLFDIVLMKID